MNVNEPIPVENGMKQGDIQAPTLFSIYFAVVLSYEFQDCDIGVYISFRTSGKVFNLRRFNTKSKTFQSLVRELLFADDADLVAHTEKDMQLIMDISSRAYLAFGLTINLKKAKVMYTPPIGQVYVEPNITVEGNRFGVVDSFIYLGSTLRRNDSHDAEISRRLLVNWKSEYGLVAVLQQTPNSVFMRLVSLQYTGIMLTYSKDFIRIAPAES